jgi:hypothetical protein
MSLKAVCVFRFAPMTAAPGAFREIVGGPDHQHAQGLQPRTPAKGVRSVLVHLKTQTERRAAAP